MSWLDAPDPIPLDGIEIRVSQHMPSGLALRPEPESRVLYVAPDWTPESEVRLVTLPPPPRWEPRLGEFAWQDYAPTSRASDWRLYGPTV